jgi:hypothetical protein
MGSDQGSAERNPAAACTLGAGDRAQRAARWQALTARALRQASQTGRGLRLDFDAGPGVEDELRSLVALEAECCAFARWSVSTAGGQLTVEVSGDTAEAVAAAQALFPALA